LTNASCSPSGASGLRACAAFQRTFVEFGVYNYVESNTRFLLLNDNWTGLVLDSSAEHIDFIHPKH
jgi:hypothetical protein